MYAHTFTYGFGAHRDGVLIRGYTCALKAPYVFVFVFLLWNDAQFQPKLLDRLEFCCTVFFKQLFPQRGMFACFVRPLLLSSPPYLCMGKVGLIPITAYMYVFHWLAKKKKKKKKKNCHRTDFKADLWPETGDFVLA